MEVKYNRTCWQGIHIEHPADWEICNAGGNREKGSIFFGDRRKKRLQVFWRKLDYSPNLEMLVDKPRVVDEDEDVEWRKVGLLEGWVGLLEKKGGASVLHCGGFFEESAMLVEAVLFWPHGRNIEGERKILSSIEVHEPDEGQNEFWQAMGIEASVPNEYGFSGFESQPGKTVWKFEKRGDKGTFINIERLGIPDYWLRASLTKWLEARLEYGSSIRSRRSVKWNGHDAVSIVSTATAIGFKRLKGMYRVSLSLGWKCETEDRVYRIYMETNSRDYRISLPEGLQVMCCKDAPVLEQSI